MKHIVLISALICAMISSITYAQNTCDTNYNPVCGTDGVTYTNACTAVSQNKKISHAGECQTGSAIDQSLSFAYKFGITKYNTINEFRPESLVTREQVAKMMLQFIKAMGGESTNVGAYECNFTDLHITDPTLTNFITDACKQGMIKGRDSQFHPHDDVSFAQSITMIIRGIHGKMNEGDEWRTPYEDIALTQGYITNKFGQPLQSITRGELIILMNTVYNKNKSTNTIYETRTIADQQINCTGVAPQKCLQITRANGSKELLYDSIEGFTYVSGYTYTVQVVGEKIPNPAADQSSISWKLIAPPVYESTSGKPNVLPVTGCDWNWIDNDILSVRAQTCNINSGIIGVNFDKTLPGVIISHKSGGITTQTPLIHLFVYPESTGLQTLLFNTHNSMIKQGLVHKDQSCMFLKNSSVIGSSIDRYDFITDTAITNNAECGPYSKTNGSASYFIKPKNLFTMMIYINNNEEFRQYIDRSSLMIKQ